MKHLITFTKDSSKQDIGRALDKYGVVLIKDYLPKENFNSVHTEYKNFLKENVIGKNILVNPSANFGSLRASGKTIINKRFKGRDGDEGLIDVWNIDQTINNPDPINKVKDYSLSILQEAFPQYIYHFKTNNLYINHSVTHTRGIHSDSGVFPSRAKSFLFMTDINDQADGPFSFILGTHKGKGKDYWHKYDIYSPLPEDASNYVIFDDAKKNDLVITCVAGAHRGLPQEVGRKRGVFVSSYDPEGHI